MIDKASLAFLVPLLAVVNAVGVTAAATAAEPHGTFAVVALVGDSITIVKNQGVTGSSGPDRNTQARVPLTDGHFDHVAARAALAEVHRLDADATVTEVDLADRQPFADSDGLMADDARRPALLSAVRPLLPAAEPHYLIVITRWRGEARLAVRDGFVASGKLSGLGFYIDTYERMARTATGESERGFIAPYACVQVTLVDLRTGAVVRTEQATETTTYPNVGPHSDLDPWNALTAERKVRLLNGLLAAAVRTGVAHVVAPG